MYDDHQIPYYQRKFLLILLKTVNLLKHYYDPKRNNQYSKGFQE